jgi:low affinity Fe/Cu permease
MSELDELLSSVHRDSLDKFDVCVSFTLAIVVVSVMWVTVVLWLTSPTANCRDAWQISHATTLFKADAKTCFKDLK